MPDKVNFEMPAQEQKTSRIILLIIILLVIGIVIVAYSSNGIGTAFFATILSFVLLWCICDLASHIVEDIRKGFSISHKEGYGRILLLFDLALGGIVGLGTNFGTGLLLSIILFCIYWMTVLTVQLIKRTRQENEY